MAHDVILLDDVRELAALLKPAWDEIRDGIPAWHPRNDGAETETEESETATTETETEATETEAATEPDWKVESRKHERRAKQERKAREELEAKLREREDADKSEQEKAIEKARDEAKAEAATEAEQERRNDRLEVAVARAAAKTFADVDDALLHIHRGINAGDIDPDDIFDDQGKVQTDALKSALDDLLERKPHLKADSAQTGAAGGSDAGRGGGGTPVDDMSVDQHLAAIKRSK